MLNRYSVPKIEQIWSEENKFSIWTALEFFASEAWAKEGLFDSSLLSGKINKILPSEVKEEEAKNCHEFQAFLEALSQKNSDNELVTRWFHYGLTSSNIIDTAYSFCLVLTCLEFLEDLKKLETALLEKQQRYDSIFMAGRTHGQNAEVISLKDFFEYHRLMIEDIINYDLPKTIKSVSVVNFGGPVGNFSISKKNIESFIIQKLYSIIKQNYSTEVKFSRGKSFQAISRMHYVDFFILSTKIMSALETLALEIRLRQQSGVSEFFEGFTASQRGSSSMPHKRNPIFSENIVGLSRIVRSAVVPALENISLWNQRDMSHSSVERLLTPQISNITSFSMKRMLSIIDGLYIDEKRISKNISESPELFSHKKLCQLIESGYTRTEAYREIFGLFSPKKDLDEEGDEFSFK